jgi:hypothetical protein
VEKTVTATSLFRERLAPPASVHLISLLIGGVAALALSLWGPVAAGVGGVGVTAVISAVLVLTSPVVQVVSGGDPADGGAPGAPRLRAGHAVIPVDALGAGTALDAAELREAMGPGADARAWVCHRSWIRSAVRLPVVDVRDSTPYWLVCTRRPRQLLAALDRR